MMDSSLDVEFKPKIGMKFDNLDEAWKFWVNYGGKTGFGVRKHYFNKNKKTGRITSYKYVCCKEGVREKDKGNFLTLCPRLQTRTNCKARIGVTYVDGKYKVNEFIEEHNHLLHPQETVHMLASQRNVEEVLNLELKNKRQRVDCQSKELNKHEEALMESESRTLEGKKIENDMISSVYPPLEIDFGQESLDQLLAKNIEKTMSIRRTLEEKEETYNTSLEEARNLLGIARDQLKGILEQQEMLDFDSENKKRRFNSWSKELNKCEAALTKENTKIRDRNGTIRCPFCVGKGEQYNWYTHLLQDATRAAEGSPQSAKQRVNHVGLATYLTNDLAEEAEPPPQTMTPSSAAEFNDDLTGFKDPKKLQKSPEVCGRNGEEWIDQSTSPGPSNYCWFARDVDTSEGPDGGYLRRKGTLKNISDNYMNLLETETKKLRCMAEGILEEQETLNLELERKRQELDSRSKELDKREVAFIERERQKLKEEELVKLELEKKRLELDCRSLELDLREKSIELNRR